MPTSLSASIVYLQHPISSQRDLSRLNSLFQVFRLSGREVGMAQFKCNLSSNLGQEEPMLWDSEEASTGPNFKHRVSLRLRDTQTARNTETPIYRLIKKMPDNYKPKKWITFLKILIIKFSFHFLSGLRSILVVHPSVLFRNTHKDHN